MLQGQPRVREGGGDVTFVNRFTTHAPDDEFERAFAEVCEFMARQVGFLGNTLLKHAKDEHSYINIAHWRDIECFQQALRHPEFEPHVARLRTLSTSDPNLYLPRLDVSISREEQK
ncbi:antibiotic biosynthesis monooxygenase family protein [Streptomyces sp. NPDC001118]